jgi:alkylation response protein AidB-like acyl-CoA dehydrogenase
MLARTDPNAPKHRGISFFLVDLKSPGITIRPLKQVDEVTHFCEVFLDNVRVPRENVLGEVNSGWQVANRLLTYERGLFPLLMVACFQGL